MLSQFHEVKKGLEASLRWISVLVSQNLGAQVCPLEFPCAFSSGKITRPTRKQRKEVRVQAKRKERKLSNVHKDESGDGNQLTHNYLCRFQRFKWS